MVRQILGFAIIVAGVIFGTYIGVWVLFIGGIVDVIEQIRAPILEAKIIAFGIAKVLSAGFVGTIIGGVLVSLGAMVLDD